MATVFRSNKIATRVIRDGSGYLGSPDFMYSADIAADNYISRSANSINMGVEGFFKATRISNLAPIFKDEKLEVEYIPPNTPRRSYIPEFKSFGIIVEEDKYNFFNQDYIENKQVEIASNNNLYCCYGVGGTIGVSSPLINILGGDGSEGNPIYFKQKTPIQSKPFKIDVTVSSDVKGVSVEQCLVKKVSSIVPAYGATKTNESLFLNEENIALGNKGTIIFRLSENKNPAKNQGSDYRAYLDIISLKGDQIAINRRVDRDLITVRSVVNKVESINQFALTSRDNVLALTWDYGNLNLSINGRSFDLSLKTESNFVPVSVSLLSEIQGWVSKGGNSTLRNVIIYDRELSVDECNKATSGWIDI